MNKTMKVDKSTQESQLIYILDLLFFLGFHHLPIIWLRARIHYRLVGMRWLYEDNGAVLLTFDKGASP